MSTTEFDDDISGSGYFDFGHGVKLIYALWHLDTLSTETRLLDVTDSDHILRTGWITFYHYADLGEAGIRRYYDPPFFLNWIDGRWTTNPSWVGTDAAGIFAWGVRWHLAPFATGRLTVVSE